MRRVLIDHARERRAAKRPGAHLKVLLDDGIGVAQPRECELMMVDGALVELTRIDPRQGQIVELRYLGGCRSRRSRPSSRFRARRSHESGRPPGRGSIDGSLRDGHGAPRDRESDAESPLRSQRHQDAVVRLAALSRLMCRGLAGESSLANGKVARWVGLNDPLGSVESPAARQGRDRARAARRPSGRSQLRERSGRRSAPRTRRLRSRHAGSATPRE